MCAQRRYPPTRRKLERSREEGDTSKSREFTAACLFLAAFLLFLVSLAKWQNLTRFSQKVLQAPADFQSNNVLVCLREATAVIVDLLVVPFGALLIVAAVAEVVQVGWYPRFSSLLPRLSRLNFFSGLKRLIGAEREAGKSALSGQLLQEVLKQSLLLFGVIGLLGLMFYLYVTQVSLRRFVDERELLDLLQIVAVASLSMQLAFFLVVGIVDLLISRVRRRIRLSMDVEEFKRELRENEGDPQTRAMRKQLHQELMLEDVLQAVRRARVLVVSK